MKAEEAYFTVEAALVFPFVLGALIMTVFLFVFQYDRCLMEQDVGKLMLYTGSLNMEQAEEARERLRKRAAEIHGEKYVAWQQEVMQITVEKNEIRVEGRGNLTFPVPSWNFFNGRNIWEASCMRSTVQLKAAEYIRTYRKLKGE